MAKVKDDYIFKLKGGEAFALECVNPFLERREPIVVFFEDGKTNIKIGDGKNNYNSLPFISDTNIDISDIQGLTEILAQYEVDLENLNSKIDKIVIDKVYDPNSDNAQSGKAVSQAINEKPGQKTLEGGISFNGNDAIGDGAQASGLNTQAGNLAFKILSIDGVIKNISEYKLWFCPYINWTNSQGENISGVMTINDIVDRSYYDIVSTEINSSDLVNAFPRTQEQIAEDGFILDESYFYSGKVTAWDDRGYSDGTLYASEVELNRIQRTYKGQPCYIITVRGDVTAGSTPYAIDDILQIECKLHYNNAFKIVKIEVVEDTSIITIVAVDNRVLDSNMVMDDPTGTNMEEDWVYVVGKNNGVICPQLRSSFVGGIDTQATGFASVGFGRKNIASGNYSAVFGRGNVGGYAALVAGTYSEGGNGGIALGNGVKALGNSAVATGVDTYARAASSRAGGRESQALSEFTVAEGLGVIAGLKQGQVVHGKYNVRNDSHLLIIGDGKSNTERHDAFVITEDYKVLLNGGKIELADTNRVDNILYGSKTLNNINNEASGTMALATGSGTIASGNYSFAGGVGSQATARSAVAIGEYNKATVQGGFAGGINAEANGFGTIALGYGVNTINSAPVYGQMAVGKYNAPNSYSLFMVGNGTSKDDRKNVFEVHKTGDVKIANALILTDSRTDKEYKIYINDGKLQLEEV